MNSIIDKGYSFVRSSVRNRTFESKSFIDEETGEVINGKKITTVVTKDSFKDRNWEMVWIKHLLFAINLVGSKSIAILSYLIENRDAENKVLGNRSSISRSLGISRITVSRTLDLLIQNKIIKEIEFAFVVNPEIIWNAQAAKKKGIRRLDIWLSFYEEDFESKEKKTYIIGNE